MPTEPNIYGVGLHRNMPEEVYHSDPTARVSLSRSMASEMLKKSPYHLYGSNRRLGALHVEPHESTEMDIGSVGHALLLGKGKKIDIGEWDDYKTKDSKEWREGCREAGRVPILDKHYQAAQAMQKEGLRQLGIFGLTDEYVAGESEVVGIWEEGPTLLRCMYDRLTIAESTVTIIDWKVTKTCEKEFLRRQVYRQFYDLQCVWYKRGIGALLPKYAGRIRFLFLFIEREWPYSLVPVELDPESEMVGQMRFDRALEMWRVGMAKGYWPTYASEILRLSPPKYALTMEAEEFSE